MSDSNNFTYSFYRKMIKSLLDHGYNIKSYLGGESQKDCILRHDIDFDIEKSLEMARIEKSLGVTSTYFVLLRTDFYNPFSKKSVEMLREIISLGHDLGLHFDEKSYSDSNVVENIKKEVSILSNCLEYQVRTVSMHRPSKQTLEANYTIEGVVNSYSNYYFKEYKYVSDSRRNWKEDVISLIESEKFNKLHILTHSFWYSNEVSNIEKDLKSFVDKGRIDRYNSLKDQISNFEEVLLL